MAEEPETTEVDDAPDEAEVVKFLFAVLDEDIVEGDGNSTARRVDAGITLLGYYTRMARNNTIEHRAAASAMAASVRSTLRRIAADDTADMEQRIRAAGASL